MICIFTRSDDQSTTDVMHWLHHLGYHEVVRVNSDTLMHRTTPDTITITNNSLEFTSGTGAVQLGMIRSAWYRKGRRWLCNKYARAKVAANHRLELYLQACLNAEEIDLANYVHFLLQRTVPCLGSPESNNLNKLTTLYLAADVGLTVPPYTITNDRQTLEDLCAHELHITKPISQILYAMDVQDTQMGYFSYTERLTHSQLSELSDRISPTFVQKEIQKDYEVRVFYLAGTCYSMAIFSQREEQTSVDFRKYHSTRPNRMVPFTLSQDIIVKLRNLFIRIGLNTGSADFIVDTDGHYHFLEINPVGQFGWVSDKCNYHLERRIAENLIAMAERETQARSEKTNRTAL
jgi:ATP-GRASP peptide maturase of grasp-with-spasm system